jgi:hypothetical protein
VLAVELGAEAILAAIRAGHSWLAESTTVGLSLEASAGESVAGIGERLRTDGESAALRLEIRGVPSGAVSFHTDRGRVHEASLPAAGSATVEWRTSAAESAFVRVEVRHSGRRMAALTNPIFLT